MATVEDVWKFYDGDISKGLDSAILVAIGAVGSTKPALLGVVTEEEAESTIESVPVSRWRSRNPTMADSEKFQKELVELKRGQGRKVGRGKLGTHPLADSGRRGVCLGPRQGQPAVRSVPGGIWSKVSATVWGPTVTASRRSWGKLELSRPADIGLWTVGRPAVHGLHHVGRR